MPSTPEVVEQDTSFNENGKSTSTSRESSRSGHNINIMCMYRGPDLLIIMMGVVDRVREGPVNCLYTCFT